MRSRNLAILALLFTFLVTAYSSVRAAIPPHRTYKYKTHHSRRRSTVHHRVYHHISHYRTARKRSTTIHRRRRRYVRRVRWSPWHVSSFVSAPGALDNTTGEDLAIRQAALQAIGHLNGCVVVVNPNNGRILSVVNQKLAETGAFTTCSTFKPIVALAALKEGVITARTRLRIAPRTRMTLTYALAHSNNAFFAALGQRVGFSRLQEYAHEFGLGEKASVDIPDEVTGVFPAVPPPAKDGGVGKLASFGEGLEVTPLQMAAIISTIANGGTLYALQYLRTPEQIAHFQPIVRRRLTDLAPYFPQVKAGLAAAVKYGTARLARSPDLDIFGKTGTCSENGARLGWFVSYSTEQQPKYVVVVLLRGGRPMFGPHAAEIAGRVYRELRQKEAATTQATGATEAAAQTQK